jgi:hypothetical protein
MQLMHVTVDATKFRQLEESQQLFLVRLGQVHNDMRHIREMVISAHNGVKAYQGLEHEIALHSLIFAVRLWCGVLNEAEDVYRVRGMAVDCRRRCTATSMKMLITH